MSDPSPTPRRLAFAAVLVLVAAALWTVRPRPSAPPPTPAPVAPPAPPRPLPVPPPVGPTVRPSSPVDAAPVVAPVAAVVDAGAAREVLRGTWGEGPGQFGRRPAIEGALEAPMSLAVGPDGEVVVLDQVNRRVQRFRDGRFVGRVPLPGESAQDLALTRDGRAVVLDRLGDPSVTVHDAAGRPSRPVPLAGGPIAEGGAVTGLFAEADGVYVEREHREVVRVADARGEPDPARPTLWGRPARDGVTLLRASLADRARGVVTVSAASRANGAMDWSSDVALDGAVLHLVLLDGDRAGRVYLGAVVGTWRAGTVDDPHVTVVRLDRAGRPEAALRIPANPEAEELFRPLVIDDAGVVYALTPSADGLAVVAYRFEG